MADDLPAASDVLATPAVVDETAPTGPESEKVDEASEQKKDVPELLSEGNAALALGKYAEASEHFSFAVEKLVEKHGEMAIETVDALEAYGNALLKNAIASSAVLGGDGATGGAKDSEKSETTTTAASAGESTASSATPSASTSAPTATSSSSASTFKPAQPKEPVTANNIRFSFGGDAADDDEDEDNDEDGGEADESGVAGGEEEVDDFETAWEVLDTARAILVKSFPEPTDTTPTDSQKERKLQLARIHSSMAEIATESGRPEDGVKEYETALSIQSTYLEPWDRLTAQTHLFIALALELVPTTNFEDSDDAKQKVAVESFGKAVEHVEKAAEILHKKKEFLIGGDKGKGKESSEDEKKDLTEKQRDELKDIEELTSELAEKIEDLKAQITEAQQKPASLQEQIFQSGPSLPENVSREVHNLNSMVKKKKKVEPASAAPAPAQAANGGENGMKRKAEEELKKEDAASGSTSAAEKKSKVHGAE